MGDVKKITFNEIESAPEEPGLYAWYLEIVFGKADTVTVEDWLSRLTEYIKQNRRPDLEVTAEAALGLRFKGRIEHDIFEAKDKWQSLAPEVVSRVSDILISAVPVAASPLYMGIATKSLRDRLTGHKQLIKSIRDSGVADVNVALKGSNEEQLMADRTFAERVVQRDIDVNTLSVHVLPLPQKGNDPEIKKTLETAEYILNRLYYPILGRR